MDAKRIKQKMWKALFEEEDKQEKHYAGGEHNDDWFMIYRPWLQRGFEIALQAFIEEEEKQDGENPDKNTVLKELRALDNAMRENQCYACANEFVPVVERFGTDILQRAMEFIKTHTADEKTISFYEMSHPDMEAIAKRDAFLSDENGKKLQEAIDQIHLMEEIRDIYKE